MPLIDAGSLWKTFENAGWWDNADRDVAQDLLDQAPSVDAEPIRHAHWIWCETYLDGEAEYSCELLEEGWACSICGTYLMKYLKSHFHDIQSYAECISNEMPTIERCPCCGAKMDEYDSVGH